MTVAAAGDPGDVPTRPDASSPDDPEEGGGLPKRIVLLLGLLTAAFTVVGSLEGITSFASLTFIVVFGAMSYLTLGQRDHENVSAIPPAIGLVGTTLFLPMMLWYLYTAQRGVFYTVVTIAAIAVAVELAYFKTDAFGYSPGNEETATRND